LRGFTRIREKRFKEDARRESEEKSVVIREIRGCNKRNQWTEWHGLIHGLHGFTRIREKRFKEHARRESEEKSVVIREIRGCNGRNQWTEWHGLTRIGMREKSKWMQFII